MTKEQIYNAICDIAEDVGASPEELVMALEEQNNAIFEQSMGEIPAEAANYIKNAKSEKNAARSERRKAEKENQLAEEIRQFRNLFPDVAAEDIPESVWVDMERGIPLPYAYALVVLSDSKQNDYAKDINDRNTNGAPPPVGESTEDGEISMEEVEAMSPKAIKNNFGRILRSIGKWKLN